MAPRCPTCGNEATSIAMLERWFCEKCWAVLPENVEEFAYLDERPIKVILVQSGGGGRTERAPKFLFASFFRRRVLNTIQIFRGYEEGFSQQVIYNEALLSDMTYRQIVDGVDDNYVYEIDKLDRIETRESPIFGPELAFHFLPGHEFLRDGEKRSAQGLPVQQRFWDDVLKIMRTNYGDKFVDPDLIDDPD